MVASYKNIFKYKVEIKKKGGGLLEADGAQRQKSRALDQCLDQGPEGHTHIFSPSLFLSLSSSLLSSLS